MPKNQETKELIDDIALFPRSEYYTRFWGTTAFDMDDPRFYNSYPRNSNARTTKEAGKTTIKFISTCTQSANTQNTKKAFAFYARTGGFRSPFAIPRYNNVLKMNKRVPLNKTNVRDALLIYKRSMSEIAVASFEREYKKTKDPVIKKQREVYHAIPIASFEYDYPCVLVQLPILNPQTQVTEAAKYWAQHPVPFQTLLLATFVAFLNYAAYAEDIPIEIVMRASFGHNTPSICETQDTFRINVGLIPACYARLIGKALFQLNLVISKITDESSKKINLDEKLHTKIRQYNAHKLIEKIEERSNNTDKIKKKKYNPQIAALKKNRDFLTAKNSDEAFERLYNKFVKINQKIRDEKGKGYTTYVPVRLKSTTTWAVMREVGDTASHSLLSECFRKQSAVDWFANEIMINLFKGEDYRAAFENALYNLLTKITYGKTATMPDVKIEKELEGKWVLENLSFKPIYKQDKDFYRIVNLLCKAIGSSVPQEELYSELEYAGVNFFTTAKGSIKVPKEDDYGSGSECYAELSECTDSQASECEDTSDGDELTCFEDAESSVSDDEDDISRDTFDDSEGLCDSDDILSYDSPKNYTPVWLKKNRVCSGMKAIVLAHYAALQYFRANSITSVTPDTEQMYYEVEEAIRFVKVPKPTREKCKQSIIYFDLNHCNATNSRVRMTLKEKLEKNNKVSGKKGEKPSSVIILDYTSSTHEEIKKALKRCFSYSEIQVVLLVESGLKNNQGGFDFNPYGEIRIAARDEKTKLFMMKAINDGFSKAGLDKLPVKAHELVRACKRAGLAVSLFNFFGGQTSPAKEEVESAMPAPPRPKLKRKT